MRTDSSSSQLSSSPSPEFLNRYSTSSIAEDKAEVWACLMCYQQVLKSATLRAKGELLKQRARKLCADMDERWWARVVDAQRRCAATPVRPRVSRIMDLCGSAARGGATQGGGRVAS